MVSMAALPVVSLGNPSANPAQPVSVNAVRFVLTEPVRELAARSASGLRPATVQTATPGPPLTSPFTAVATDGLPSEDPLVKPPNYSGAMAPPLLTFEGLGVKDNKVVLGVRFRPSDSNGDIGPNHYVETVNSVYRVFDRSGVPLMPPMKYSTLFASLGEPSSANDDGDPIVRYDQMADRWVITLIVISEWLKTNGPAHEVVAISKTGDPTGQFYVYDFPMPNDNLNDYPKLGIWPDAYYLSINQFNHDFEFTGAGVFAYDRAKLLAGDPTAGAIFFDLQSFTNFPNGLLPSDLDGPPPEAGTPNTFACLISDQISGQKPGENDRGHSTAGADEEPSPAPGHLPFGLRLFDFTADFAHRDNSSFVEKQLIVTAPFRIFDGDSDLISQRGTTNGLDSLSDRLMYRMQFRHFGDHESLVVNHTVKVDPNGRAGVRYYELRRFPPAGPFFLQDQGTHAPDSESRWMASVALDWQGNLAAGYSISGRDMFPSIRYAGRVGGDAAGGLNMSEATLYAGSGSQLGSETQIGLRWGDYTMMAVDPMDESTFWYVNQYYTNFDIAGWHTRIGSFRFPASVPAPKAALQVTTSDADTQEPILGAIITLGNGYWRRIDSTSGANFRLPPGDYLVSANAPGYEPIEGAPVSLAGTPAFSQQLKMKRLKYALDLSTTNDLVFSGAWHGSATPDSITCTLTNAGTQPVAWSANWNDSWLVVSPSAGVLAAGATTNLTLGLSPDGANLPPGTYRDSLVIANLSSGAVITREVTLTVVRNPGTLTLSSSTYTAVKGQTPFAVTIERVGGADGTVQVDFATADASALAGVDYEAQKRTIIFAGGQTNQSVPIPLLDGAGPPSKTFLVSIANPANGAQLGEVTSATVTILRTNGLVWQEFFNSDPGWKTEGQWAFGVPGGAPDPAAGYTGKDVYGYNLSGDYSNNIPSTYYLTGPVFDCSRYEKVTLYFARWLGVERSLSDHASVEVSSDQSHWTTIWSNPADAAIQDFAWVNVSYDISAVADRKPAVSLRWGMGPTDGSWTFAGWNIDDVEVFGTPVSQVTTQAAGLELSGRLDSAHAALVLSWASQSNQLYAVEFTRDLSEPFQVLEAGIAATPPVNSYTSSVMPADRARFYRIRVQE